MPADKRPADKNRPAKGTDKPAPVPNEIKREGKTGRRGSALAGEVLKNVTPPENKPGAVTLTGRQPHETKPFPPPDIGPDEVEIPPMTPKEPPKPTPHWRSK